MKITSVECYLGTGAIGGFVTMKINTDSGIYGWGEAGLAYGKSAEAAFGQCQDFGKLILGMDPFNTEEIWEHLQYRWSQRSWLYFWFCRSTFHPNS